MSFSQRSSREVVVQMRRVTNAAMMPQMKFATPRFGMARGRQVYVGWSKMRQKRDEREF